MFKISSSSSSSSSSLASVLGTSYSFLPPSLLLNKWSSAATCFAIRRSRRLLIRSASSTAAAKIAYYNTTTRRDHRFSNVEYLNYYSRQLLLHRRSRRRSSRAVIVQTEPEGKPRNLQELQQYNTNTNVSTSSNINNILLQQRSSSSSINNVIIHHRHHRAYTTRRDVNKENRNRNRNRNNNNNKITATVSSSDPSMATWVDAYVPPSLRPYAKLSRMDKPIGTWLLLWPCYWSTAMAAGLNSNSDNTTTTIAINTISNSDSNNTDNLVQILDLLPDPKLLGMFTVGAFVMRGAGCTINDMWDQDIDSNVERTKARPLACGEVTQPQAFAWLALQLVGGLTVLLTLPTQHTLYCFAWGAASLPIIAVYPFMKRIFDYPQLILGLCFNWGIFMGWAAVHGPPMMMHYTNSSILVPLYAGCVLWTVGYDTLYAHQDKTDDAKLGLKSTAITFGRRHHRNNNDNDVAIDMDDTNHHKRILHKLAIATYGCWLLAGYNNIVATSSSLSSSLLLEATTTMTSTTAALMSASSSSSAAISDLLMLPTSHGTSAAIAISVPFGIYATGITAAYAHLNWQIRTADLNEPINLAERFRSNATVGGIVFGSIVASKLAFVVL